MAIQFLGGITALLMLVQSHSAAYIAWQ